MKRFYNAAKEQLGYTSEQLKNNSNLLKEVDALKYEKLEQWINEKGASSYKVGNFYAVSDAVANKGTISSLKTLSGTARSLNGLKIGGKAIVLVAIGLDAYEIYTSENKARTITSVVGGWGGAAAGAPLGAKGGAIIGVGVGAAVGGLVGGISGYFIGREITETVYDLVSTKGYSLSK